MTCSECQLEIFDTELSANALVHLTGCDDCRALDREVRLNASALAALREDVLPVRAPRRVWPWAVAAAAALLAAALFIPREPAPALIATITPSPAPVVATPAPPAPKPVRRVKPKLQPTQVAKAEPLMIKMLTDDPEVVIYWIVDPTQGE